MGQRMRPLDLVISAVAAGSPAAEAGVAANDLLVKLDRAQPRNAAEVRDIFQQHAPGDAVPIVLERRGSRRELTATLGADRKCRSRREEALIFAKTVEI
jgi:S1-C subfamily serine protease